MSKNSKTVLWVVIVLVVLGLIWWVYAANMNSNSSGQTNGYGQTSNALNSTVSSGNSNADLNQDMSKVDAQMNGLNSDSASAQSTNGSY